MTRLSQTDYPRRAQARRAEPVVRKDRRSFRKMIAGVVAAASAIAGVTLFLANAEAATIVITVNSPAYGGAAANPSSGVCETAAGNGNCTLRAAIEVSNALNRPAGEVLINVASTIQMNTKMTGSMNSSSNFMYTTSMNRQDSGGAQYYVTAPVIIDLGHRLQPDSGSDDSGENAMFYITGSDVQILNVDNALGSGSSFVIGATARNITINGDTMGANGGFGTMYASSWGPERFVVVMQGAQNVYVANYKISGYYDSNADGGIFVFATPSASTPANITQNIVFENIQVTNQNTGSCSGSSATGCNARVLTFWQGSNSGTDQDSYQYNVINGLTFRGIVINFLSQSMYGFQFANPSTTANNQSSDITNLTIENCQFLRITPTSNNQQNAFVVLPYAANLHGTNVIRNNVFTTPTTTNQGGTATAIYFVGSQAAGSTTPSNLSITGNYFNGHGGAGTIRTKGVGLVTISGNTFGAATKSYANASEESTDTNVMYSMAPGTTPYTSTNQAILTWAPTTGSATVLTGLMPSNAVPLETPGTSTLPTCTATVTVTKPTATVGNTTIPADPVTLDVYWTGVQTAEVYLGKVTGLVGPNALLALPLPVGVVTLPDGNTVKPVDPTTGAASGFVRVQTQVEGKAQLESSQYSRVVPVVGNCRPALTVSVAPGMTDPTMGRDLHFILTSSMPLDPNTVTPGIISITATAVPQTYDSTRLNPTLVSVVPVANSGDTQFEIVVRVDDSALVTLSVGAGAVTSDSGMTNPAASASADKGITFLNPIQVIPASFTLVTGEPHGKAFTIILGAGAPLPTDDLQFSATVTQPSGTPQVTLSTLYPDISAGATSSAPVNVTAAAGNVTANTPVGITLTLESVDTNYSGLVVPSVTPYLFSTDPTIQIVKAAYINVGDTSTPTQIEATGTIAPTGSRLTDGQMVCFVYTVTNTSKDDWATSLTNVVVTDSDPRLGSGGVIGTIASIPMGQYAKLASCVALVPVDTTVANPGAGSP